MSSSTIVFWVSLLSSKSSKLPSSWRPKFSNPFEGSDSFSSWFSETSDSFIKNYKIQKFKSDDLVAICSAGAYGSCMASNYNLRGEAEEIFIKQNKEKAEK